ncbi:putative hydrolase of the HAD superfamily [Streptococcus equinus]|uniref:Putative hydrolase of the HAD superfamily n=1 Tax=Streptococcus equinus TaxID=1335 RepID=A0A1H0Z2Q9_STREI|nr:HAD family hydrolase [Streptococcus equinus]SDQ21421.1 putative hydrolase of the HAD superfamily [Streptococcus equinus]
MANLQYKNYIFDFYGTLVDIETDEENPQLWEQMAELYRAYGADYTGQALKTHYDALIKRQEEQLRKRLKLEYVEVDLVHVFIELMLEAPQKHATDSIILDLETWGNLIAQTFRMLSRKKLQAYEHTLATLKALKAAGAKVILLSNAQRAFTQAEIEMTGCREFLDKIYISSDHKMKKPQVDFMNLVLEENQLDPKESVMVGNDFTSDMAIAQAAGMDGIMLNTFPYSQEDIQNLNTMNAKVIDDISELVG